MLNWRRVDTAYAAATVAMVALVVYMALSNFGWVPSVLLPRAGDGRSTVPVVPRFASRRERATLPPVAERVRFSKPAAAPATLVAAAPAPPVATAEGPTGPMPAAGPSAAAPDQKCPAAAAAKSAKAADRKSVV